MNCPQQRVTCFVFLCPDADMPRCTYTWRLSNARVDFMTSRKSGLIGLPAVKKWPHRGDPPVCRYEG